MTWYLRAGGWVRDGRVGRLWTLVSSEEEGAFPADTGRATPFCAQFRANGLGDGRRGGADGAETQVWVYPCIAVVVELVWVGMALEERHCSGGIPSASTVTEIKERLVLNAAVCSAWCGANQSHTATKVRSDEHAPGAEWVTYYPRSESVTINIHHEACRSPQSSSKLHPRDPPGTANPMFYHPMFHRHDPDASHVIDILFASDAVTPTVLLRHYPTTRKRSR